MQEEAADDDNILFTTTAEGKRVPICYNCRKSGHYQNECTNPPWKECDIIGIQMCIFGQVEKSKEHINNDNELLSSQKQPLHHELSSLLFHELSSLLFLQVVEENYDDEEDELGLLFATTTMQMKTTTIIITTEPMTDYDKFSARAAHLFNQAYGGRAIKIW